MIKPLTLTLSCLTAVSAFALSNNIEISTDGIFVTTQASSISSDDKKEVAVLANEASSLLAVSADERAPSPLMSEYLKKAQARYSEAGVKYSQNKALRSLVRTAQNIISVQ